MQEINEIPEYKPENGSQAALLPNYGEQIFSQFVVVKEADEDSIDDQMKDDPFAEIAAMTFEPGALIHEEEIAGSPGQLSFETGSSFVEYDETDPSDFVPKIGSLSESTDPFSIY